MKVARHVAFTSAGGRGHRVSRNAYQDQRQSGETERLPFSCLQADNDCTLLLSLSSSAAAASSAGACAPPGGLLGLPQSARRWQGVLP